MWASRPNNRTGGRRIDTARTMAKTSRRLSWSPPARGWRSTGRASPDAGLHAPTPTLSPPIAECAAPGTTSPRQSSSASHFAARSAASNVA
jgi:hypothetical protein